MISEWRDCQVKIIIMMSLKDQGNQFFRVGSYEAAIKCYEEYIEYDPQSDKKVAYCNISFCHYKLKDYKDSIESADDSISEDPTYHKAYYRKLQAYKQLGNHQYDVYINAVLLLRFCPKMEQKQKYDYQLLIKDQKRKWYQKFQRDPFEIKSDDFIFQHLSSEMEVEREKTLDEWIQEWKQNDDHRVQYWPEILKLVKEKGQYGLNLAFLYLNQLDPSSPQQTILKQQIKSFQVNIEGKMEIEDENQIIEEEKQNEEPKKEWKQSSSSEENLFQSEDKQGEKLKQENYGKEQTFSSFQSSKIETTPKLLQNKIKNRENVFDFEQKKDQNPTQTELYSQVPLNSENVDVLFRELILPLEKSRDQISQLLQIIQKILSSSLAAPVKQQLLQMIKDKFNKQVHLMKKSFSKKQQSKVHELLLSNALQIFIPDFASRYVPQ